MNIVRKYWLVATAFIVGLFIGLVVLGWGLWPVEWENATPGQLDQVYQDAYVTMTAELYSLNGNSAMVQQALGGWGGDVVACNLAATTADTAERARLEAVATVTNGTGCTGVVIVAPEDVEEGGGSNNNALFIALGLLLVLALIVAAIFYLLNKRKQVSAQPGSQESTYEELPDSAPAAISEPEGDVAAVPIARFHTTYTRGHDAYDDSFSIENSNAEFLGECGVGLAESIGTDLPKNVTALEIWLFDKSDIRTITKVVMSDHAFFDDALKAKLAPKGEPVLARETETIVLETASLIINAEITEMEYGTNSAMPAKSTIDRITFSLSVWSKGGGEAQIIEGEVDNLMEF